MQSVGCEKAHGGGGGGRKREKGTVYEQSTEYASSSSLVKPPPPLLSLTSSCSLIPHVPLSRAVLGAVENVAICLSGALSRHC